MLRESNVRLAANLSKYYMLGVGEQHLTVRAIKRQIDGALGSRAPAAGSLLRSAGRDSEYQRDEHEDLGDIRKTATRHRQWVSALRAAIGDRANREVLNIYEAAFRSIRTRRIYAGVSNMRSTSTQRTFHVSDCWA